MEFAIYILFFQLLFYYQSTFTNSKPLEGPLVRQSTEREYNFIVSIKRVTAQDGYGVIQHECTGTLISRHDVLTAGHCLHNKLLNEMQIIIGEVDIRLGRIYYPFWWILYNEWAQQMQIELQYPTNDVALIRLSERVPRHIIPPHISNTTNEQLCGLRTVAAGWSYSNGVLNTAMQTAILTILSKDECDQQLTWVTGQSMNVDMRIICTTSNPHVILQPGDNGGPLLYRHKVVAINIGTCQQSAADYRINLHSGVDFYRGFILYMIQNF